MNPCTALVMSFALFTGCSKPAGSNGDFSTPIAAVPASALSPYQTLIVGPNRQIAITNIPPTYHFEAAPGIRLDLTKFSSQRDTSTIAPDTVQIILDSGIYKLSKPDATNFYDLNPATLAPLRGPAFVGFHSGDRGMLAIGHTMPEAAGSGSLAVFWVAKFYVK